MDEGLWRAPGRDGGTPDAEPPAPARPPSPGYDPYAAPSPSAGNPYAAQSPGTPSAAPGYPPHDPFAADARHRDRVLGGPGYDSPAYRNDRVAAAAMVLGVVGVIVPGICLFAVALGHLGLRRLRTSYDGGRGLAIAGLALGYAMTAVWLGLFLLFLSTRSLL
ncbi:DUF4190 domain-containing protein [Georgenia phoenicis]|uniref:DUF4190 domain-containing protein n=1 Tax=unclassified Georgenia TaxID=2626815 RepID=UPI0039AF5A55